jgi:hypothetical protein
MARAATPDPTHQRGTMPTCINCHEEFTLQIKRDRPRSDREICERCSSITAGGRLAESRQASVVKRQVWTFSAARGLEQKTLSRPAASVVIDSVRTPRWYVGPKGMDLPRAAIYSSEAPNAALLGRVAREASERFSTEPWMG